MTSTRRHRFLARIASVLAATWALAVVSPAPAHAHAELLYTVPANGQTVQQPPRRVQMRFSEDVSVAFGGVHAYGPTGKRIDSARALVRGRRVTLQLPDAGPGSYAVSWRITSEDGHAVRGTFAWDVDHASGTSAVRAARRAADAPRILVALAGVTRGITLTAFIIALGSLLWWEAVDRRRRPHHLALWSLLIVLSTLLSYVIDAAVAGGYTAAQACDASVLRAEATTPFGRAALVRVALLVVVLIVSRLTMARRRPWPLLVLLVACAGTFAASGHALAARPQWLHVGLDLLHVVATAAWFGALVHLAAASRATTLTRDVVERYSRLALASVCVLLATGGVAAIREVGIGADAWLSTTYGRLVLVKIVCILLIIAAGTMHRLRLIPRLATTGDSHAFRRLVTGELVVGAFAIAAAAWLVMTPPARSAAASTSVDELRRLPDGTSAQLVVDPARAGRNEVHAYVQRADGSSDESVTDAILTLDEPDLEIHDLDIPLLASGPGHYTTPAANIPYAGTWSAQLHVRRGEFSDATTRFRFRIASRR